MAYLSSIILGLIAWFLGIGSLLSFNLWSEVNIIGDLNFLNSMDFLANQFLMPLGGMFVAIFAGWFLSTKIIKEELEPGQKKIFIVWRFFIKFISPTLVALIFINQLFFS